MHFDQVPRLHKRQHQRTSSAVSFCRFDHNDSSACTHRTKTISGASLQIPHQRNHDQAITRQTEPSHTASPLSPYYPVSALLSSHPQYGTASKIIKQGDMKIHKWLQCNFRGAFQWRSNVQRARVTVRRRPPRSSRVRGSRFFSSTICLSHVLRSMRSADFDTLPFMTQ
jgi:hypothetical protein